MSREPCPALFVHDEFTVVLPHVRCTFWTTAYAHNASATYSACDRSEASSLGIDVGSRQPMLYYVSRGDNKRMQVALDFLHALATYWETKV